MNTRFRFAFIFVLFLGLMGCNPGATRSEGSPSSSPLLENTTLPASTQANLTATPPGGLGGWMQSASYS
jgi:hypothetical protein